MSVVSAEFVGQGVTPFIRQGPKDEHGPPIITVCVLEEEDQQGRLPFSVGKVLLLEILEL